jgi:hypothetical protein
VTNARFTSLHRLMVGPDSLTTTPVPFRKTRARHEPHRVASKDRLASACGSPTVVSLQAAFLRLSAYAPLSRSPNRRPKPCKNPFEPEQLLHFEFIGTKTPTFL